MEPNKLILIYNDSPIFGGHEIMTIKIANLLIEKYKVCFIFYNPEIGKRLNNKINKMQINILSKLPFAGLRSLNIIDIFRLIRLIKVVNPNLTIISQGTVELSLKGALASKLLGIKTVSYIPLAFPSHSMKVKFGRIRDMINRYFLKSFDAFITISSEQKKYLTNYWNVSSEIFLLPNFIEMDSSINNYTPLKFSTPIKIGVVSRIDFKQKRHDKLITIAKLLKNEGLSFKLIIIGDGPDKKKLLSMIKKHELEKFFSFPGWINDTEKIYSLFDILLITSDYEGVPMNMLEAIIHLKPVIAPNQGIFKEYLTDEFLYNNYLEIKRSILFVLNNISYNLLNILLSLKNKVYNLHSSYVFNKTLTDIIEKII